MSLQFIFYGVYTISGEKARLVASNRRPDFICEFFSMFKTIIYSNYFLGLYPWLDKISFNELNEFFFLCKIL